MRTRARQLHDECMSSEDEHIDRTDGQGGQPRFGHPPNVRVSSLKREQPNANPMGGKYICFLSIYDPKQFRKVKL